jgi:hypothetical protein
MPERIQRQRTKGWRMPEAAVYVGRPSPWGNPFEWNGKEAPWMALSFGCQADEAGRREAAVLGFRWWVTRGNPKDYPGLPGKRKPADAGGGEIEYSSGRIAPIGDVVAGLGTMMFLRQPLAMPPVPDLTPLRGKDLACWCPLAHPCHADVLIELANA